MNTPKFNITTSALMLLCCFAYTGCNNDKQDMKEDAPFIYLTQAAFPSPYPVPNNYRHEEGSEMISVPLSVHRAGLDKLDAYSVNVNILNELVDGTEKLPEEAYTLPSIVNSPEQVRVCEFSLDLKLDFLRKDHKGKTYSIVLEIANPSKYIIEPTIAKVAIRIDPVELLKVADLYYNWVPLFKEDFDSSAVNPDIWAMYDSDYGHANIGTLKPEAFSINNGILNLTCQMSPKYTRVVTGGMKHKTPFLYGKIEFRAKSMLDPSGNVGGVILTWPASEKWPQEGEIDLYEILNPRTPTLNTFIHHPDFVDPNKDQHVQFTHTGLDRTQWHTFRMDWFPDYLHLYVDGVKVWELTDKRRIPQAAHRFVIQAGSKSNVIENPTTLEVDWIRVYQVKTGAIK